MQIDIYSDLHVDSWLHRFKDKPLLDYFKPSDSPTAIFAGDSGDGDRYYHTVISELSKIYDNVIHVPGNHCMMEDRNTHRVSTEFIKWKTFTPIETFENYTILVEGIKFACSTLWTNFRNNFNSQLVAEQCVRDFVDIPNMTGQKMVDKHNYCLKFLEDNSDADVFVTHFGPFLQSEHEDYKSFAHLNPYFINDKSQWFSNLQNKPKIWIHGHTHKNMDYIEQGCRVLANPHGYYGENTKEPEFIPLTIQL